MDPQEIVQSVVRRSRRGDCTVPDGEGLRTLLPVIALTRVALRRSPPGGAAPFGGTRGEGLGRAAAVLDARYRGLWATPLPRARLHQPTLHALAHPPRSALILYPAADPAARVQRIALQDPVRAGRLARVALV